MSAQANARTRSLKWRFPPRAKVYEALSAVADNRVIIGDGKARVVSSSGTKTYDVEWVDQGKRIISNDNASYWQGYAGYPIIAVLMVLGKLPYDEELARKLAGIHWKELNKQHNNNYDKAVEAVLRQLQTKGTDPATIVTMAEKILESLKNLDIEKLENQRRHPPTE